METYRRLTELPEISASALTIGNFDGLHRGHQAVIDRLVNFARSRDIPSAVLTFDPHPGNVLTLPGRPIKQMIITMERKLELLDRCGVDLALVMLFDLEFSQVSAADFLSRVIVAHFKPRRIIVGYDHHFGNRRQGDAGFLDSNSGKYGYKVEVIAGVTAGNRAVSSTAIRELLLAGKCVEAEQLLGWTYEITGRVVRGEGRGAEIGFPTANLLPDESGQLVPRDGVYVVSVRIDQDTVFGMGNIGIRPTFNGEERSIEAHLFSPPVTELYDRRIAIRFHHRLRDEKRFQDVRELKKQLQQDQMDSLNWIAEYQGG